MVHLFFCIFCLLLVLSSHSKAAGVILNNSCYDLGATAMSDDKTQILLCAFPYPSSAATCASGGGCKWKSMSNSQTSLVMIPPRLVLEGKDPISWTKIFLNDAPSSAKYVLFQYRFVINLPDDQPPSHIYGRAKIGSPTYLITAGRAAAGGDAVAGGGQSFIPFDTATKSVEVMVDRLFSQGYRIWVIGYM